MIHDDFKYNWWKISIYDNYNKNVLNLTDYGVIRIEHKDGYKIIITKPYTKEERNIRMTCSYIENDIKYFMKQCLTFKRLQYDHVLNI